MYARCFPRCHTLRVDAEPDAACVVVGVEEVRVDAGAVGLDSRGIFPCGLRCPDDVSWSGSQAASMMMLCSTPRLA